MEPVETYEYNGCTIEVYPDCDCESPREWDNFCHIWCWHKQYNLGDGDQPASSLFESWSDIECHLAEEVAAVQFTPLYLFDHSGLVLRAGRGFSDCDPQGWDWGQVGFAFVTKEDIEREYDEVTEETRARAEQLLKAEISTYCDYIRGNVWGFRVLDATGEVVDSCWGFYGDMWREDSYMIEEAKAFCR